MRFTKVKNQGMILLFILFSFCGCKEKWDVLSESDRVILKRTLAHWETWVPAKKEEGSAPLMTFEELYQGLHSEEQDFLNRVRAIEPVKIEETKKIHFQKITGQTYEKNGKRETLGPQYLPQPVYRAYQRMMQAMQRDLGKNLLIESGYRAPAFQLYTFLYYLPHHAFSIVETRRWVALPGLSEHGNPQKQALDFINQAGVNGDDHAEDFEELEEYKWLQAHAHEFGFELSYPRATKGTTFEPWHWRYGDLRSIR